MLIGIDASRANKKQKTGVEWYSFFLIEALKKIKTPHRFRLYTNAPLEGVLSNLPENFEAKILNWPLKLFWTQIRLALEVLINPPEVLFVPAHALPFFCMVKTAVTIHDVGFAGNPGLYSKLDRLYQNLSIGFASRFADVIICPSQFSKRELIRYFKAKEGKIKVIFHGPPPLSDTGINYQEVNVEPSNFLLFVGRLEKKKNILNILKAFKIVGEKYVGLKLVLAGKSGYGWEEAYSYVKQNNLSNRVEIRSYVSEMQKAQLYREAKMLVFPTLYEGFGLPILEAQASGCPVLTSLYGASPEVAGQGALLVNPEDPFDIALGIRKILDSRETRDGLIFRGTENLKKFDWRITAESTLESFSG